ncbi:hypothetical protein ACJX0J_006728 [Zea mays]
MHQRTYEIFTILLKIMLLNIVNKLGRVVGALYIGFYMLLLLFISHVYTAKIKHLITCCMNSFTLLNHSNDLLKEECYFRVLTDVLVVHQTSNSGLDLPRNTRITQLVFKRMLYIQKAHISTSTLMSLHEN